MKKPGRIFIGHGDDTRRLYKLEDSRNSLIRSCAKELSNLFATLDPPRKEIRDLLPQALFDTMTSFERTVSYTAARAFVEFVEAQDDGAEFKSVYEKDNPEGE